VIIHLPPEVDLVCLSATVSNAEELADWVGTVRGSTRAVIEERRPVPLHNLFLVGERRSEHLLMLPTFVEGRPNPRGIAVTARAEDGWRASRRSGLFTPRRAETVELLEGEGLLPAIYFIFSRAGCDEAVRQCMREGRRLTSPAERRQIREVAESATGHLSDADLSALNYGEWLASLEAGFAAHHAGMVPPFKEAVEHCFLSGLVKAVFATETLSLGINMPARSVVIEKLSKFTGERVEPLTPGEYTQLTGRAGRRGTDEVGYAVVLWSPGVTFDQVASLAGARSYALTSSFRPTYNMASNLVRRCTPSQAHHLLNLSFAQYRSDADIVRLESYLERSRQELEHALAEAQCERGDVFEYRRLAAGTHHRAQPRRAKPEEIAAAMEGLRPGDVLVVPARKPGGVRTNDRVAVLSTRERKKGDVSVRAITAGRRLVSFSPKDFHSPPRAVAHVELPVPFAPKSREFQRRIASSLADVRSGSRFQGDGHPDGTGGAAAHPVAACTDVRTHLKAAGTVERVAHQVERLESQVLRRTESLARQFDRVLQLLERWGYVKGWSLTAAGSRLARIYHEQDLLVTECAERGILDGLGPAELAGLLSVFTYEPRGPGAGEGDGAPLPSRKLQERWRAVQSVALELNLDEQSLGLVKTRPPDAGFVTLASGWANGKELASLLAPLDDGSGRGAALISAGDFVRNVKQLIDLLRQLGDVLADGGAARSAREAAGALFRGVVAASSVVNSGD
jgi:ATP-dependent RNA helicase HelY